MNTAPAPPDLAADPVPPRLLPPPWVEFARAPLVPIALAVSLGLVADRYLPLPSGAGLVVAVVGLAGWVVVRRRRPAEALGCLWAACGGLAAEYHHAHRHSFAADDVGEVAAADPALVRLRGSLVDDPVTRLAPTGDPLTPANQSDRDAVVLRVSGLATRDGTWAAASGLARLTVERDADAKGRPPLDGLRAGDAVELVGMLVRPGPPRNPGEQDSANVLLDQRIRAEVRVTDTAAGVTRLEPGGASPEGVLAAARRHATSVLTDWLPSREAATAVALLLGDGAAMDRSEWDAYVRTGVVHALAISGQHLAVLAGFLWLGLRAAGVRRGCGAWAVMLVVVAYTVLTGLRPSGVRAAAMVVAVGGGLVLRRPTNPANAFALGWLAVVALNPADPFTLGCRLSFVSVFVLVWGVGRWLRPAPPTPLERLIAESRPPWEQVVRRAIRVVGGAYLVTLVLGVVNAPLVVADQNVVSPVGLVIGPPVVVLTSVALVAGFLLLVLSPLGPVAAPFAAVTRWTLAGCEHLVGRADGWPGGAVYLPGVPGWWLVGFYAGLAAVVLVSGKWRVRAAGGLAAWVVVAVVASPRLGPSDSLTVTFLAVGKGGCTVIETPDGRCLVYDVGTTAGPHAVRRVVAPYLWSRGVRRVDELFLSHADSDHFNGVAELLRRFPVGQVTLTPSFADKPTAEVAAALLALKAAGLQPRTVSAGAKLVAGEVSIEILHPPDAGPPGIENERSLVLLVEHAGHRILLTGDLEKSGTAALLDQPPRPVDVLMAPHHGSRAALPRRLVEWAGPKLVVVNRGPALGNTITARDAGPDRPAWDTQTAGAITLRSHRTGLVATAFRTGEVRVLRSGGAR